MVVNVKQPVTSVTITQYRALIGCLSTCSQAAIPQGAGDASILAGKVTSLTWDDVKEATPTLQKLKETAIPLHVLKMVKKKSLLVFADACLSNLTDGRTQVSMLMGWVNTQTFRVVREVEFFYSRVAQQEAS